MKYPSLLLRLRAIAVILSPGPCRWAALSATPAAVLLRRRLGGPTFPGVVLHIGGTVLLNVPQS